MVVVVQHTKRGADDGVSSSQMHATIGLKGWSDSKGRAARCSSKESKAWEEQEECCVGGKVNQGEGRLQIRSRQVLHISDSGHDQATGQDEESRVGQARRGLRHRGFFGSAESGRQLSRQRLQRAIVRWPTTGGRFDAVDACVHSGAEWRHAKSCQ